MARPSLRREALADLSEETGRSGRAVERRAGVPAGGRPDVGLEPGVSAARLPSCDHPDLCSRSVSDRRVKATRPLWAACRPQGVALERPRFSIAGLAKPLIAQQVGARSSAHKVICV